MRRMIFGLLPFIFIITACATRNEPFEVSCLRMAKAVEQYQAFNNRGNKPEAQRLYGQITRAYVSNEIEVYLLNLAKQPNLPAVDVKSYLIDWCKNKETKKQ